MNWESESVMKPRHLRPTFVAGFVWSMNILRIAILFFNLGSNGKLSEWDVAEDSGTWGMSLRESLLN